MLDSTERAIKNQKMPRLDMVASARTQALNQNYSPANDKLDSGEYVSYALGLSFEYPFGNRQRKAELRKRKLERSRAVSDLQNFADQIATQVKEGIRAIETNHLEIEIQKENVTAAKSHLQALNDNEAIREKLTPEYLLVKLQAQEDLANAQRSKIRAAVDYNVSLARLAQSSGTVLQLHRVQSALTATID